MAIFFIFLLFSLSSAGKNRLTDLQGNEVETGRGQTDVEEGKEQLKGMTRLSLDFGWELARKASGQGNKLKNV